jgi:hypothetical protein
MQLVELARGIVQEVKRGEWGKRAKISETTPGVDPPEIANQDPLIASSLMSISGTYFSLDLTISLAQAFVFLMEKAGFKILFN